MYDPDIMLSPDEMAEYSTNEEFLSMFRHELLAVIGMGPDFFLSFSEIQRRKFVMNWILAFPEKHDQGVYVRTSTPGMFNPPNATGSCGTAACLAGWAALFAGREPIFESAGHTIAYYIYDSVAERFISNDAGELLGILPEEREKLFYPDNTARDLYNMILILNNGGDIFAYASSWDDDE